MKVGEDSERDSDYLEISPLVNYLKASSCQKDGFHKEDEEHSLEYECLHCKHAQGISTQASFMVVGEEICVCTTEKTFWGMSSLKALQFKLGCRLILCLKQALL